MLESDPSIFWMIIVAMITVGILLILFYTAMVLKQLQVLLEESTISIRDARRVLADLSIVVHKLNTTMDSVDKIIVSFSENVMQPMQSIGQTLKFISKLIPHK